MTDDDLLLAARAAIADFPPLTDEVLNKLAAILAPLAEQPNAAEPARMKPKPARRNAA